MRAPVDHIAAPPFPPGLRWLNSAPLQMERQLGRPVLIEFWDFCRSNSIRTLPYMKAWHERYSGLGLLVIAGSLGAFLAPPFSGLDTLPALGVVLLSLGVLLEDFALVVLALIVGGAGVLLEIILGRAAVRGIGNLF